MKKNFIFTAACLGLLASSSFIYPVTTQAASLETQENIKSGYDYDFSAHFRFVNKDDEGSGTDIPNPAGRLYLRAYDSKGFIIKDQVIWNRSSDETSSLGEANYAGTLSTNQSIAKVEVRGLVFDHDRWTDDENLYNTESKFEDGYTSPVTIGVGTSDTVKLKGEDKDSYIWMTYNLSDIV